MRNVKSLVAAAASLMSSVAFAADMPIAPPPAYAPPIVDDFGGWYLRGDIGFSNQRVDHLSNALDVTTTSSIQNLSFNTAGIFGLGVGYQFNNWFRADVTGEYRGNSQFYGTDQITFPGGVGADTYHATKNEWVVLGNIYADLGTWWGLTPFVGAGVGGARVSINGFTDTGITNIGTGALPGLAFGDSVSRWNFAWAVHAGLAYRVSPNFTVELAYRYLDMGDGLTGDLRTFDGLNSVVNPTTFNHLTSHDFKLGVRWYLDSPEPYMPPAPLIRKG
ncbi:outer membrane protein [Bradyrhizobium lablabi]|uniref:outer membrane protein n=1 Tax=Bradyrhizobium lablabi TaxID=722472 RepID=UPI001BA90D5D|nr:outer membrane beta-barrel protein [Bradyrhizobium lablabi]MBR0694132.1 porin family protein [Bradyrhizobium lablabi]